MADPASPMTRIELDLALSSDPIAGTLRADGVEYAFNGWLELINALEDARAALPADPDDFVGS